MKISKVGKSLKNPSKNVTYRAGHFIISSKLKTFGVSYCHLNCFEDIILCTY